MRTACYACYACGQPRDPGQYLCPGCRTLPVLTVLADWVALVHPAVGTALAAMLTEVATCVEQDGGQVQTSTQETALAVARAVLGAGDR